MAKTIEIDGKTYKLVPVEEEKTVVQEKEPESSGTIKEANPEVSDYRERYKRKDIRLDEVSVKPKRREFKRQDTALDDYSFQGEPLFFGKGLEQEF